MKRETSSEIKKKVKLSRPVVSLSLTVPLLWFVGQITFVSGRR